MTEDEARARVVASMCPAKVCRTCGEPSRRIVGEPEYVQGWNGRVAVRKGWTSGIVEGKAAHSNKPNSWLTRVAPTLGFTDCGHDDWRPGKWLDPFQNESEEFMLTLGNIDER